MFKARLQTNVSQFGLPEEVAFKIVRWKTSKAKGKEMNEWEFFKQGYKLNHVKKAVFKSRRH